MNAKHLDYTTISMFTPIRALIVIATIMFLLSACVTPPPFVTFSEPKVYNNDQVAVALGDQYRKLQTAAAAAKLSSKDIQTIVAIKQARSLDVNVAASPAGTTPITAPEKIAADKIDLSKLTAPDGEVGLSYIASLRKKMNDEWETLGRSLFLSGDKTFKDAENLVLVRFDVSINNYIEADWFGDTKRFYYIKFVLCDYTDDDCKENSIPKSTINKIKVYVLEPEFSSAVSKESLVTEVLENYQGEIGGTAEGVNLQGALGYQRGLYEGISQLIEEPLQFAVYGSETNQFSCALGPARKIVKRSWINPARIFGDTYRIDHVVEPGMRQCYALISLPKKDSHNKDLSKIHVSATFSELDDINKCGLSDLDIISYNKLDPKSKAKFFKGVQSCGFVNWKDILINTYRDMYWGEWPKTFSNFDITIPTNKDINTASLSTTYKYNKGYISDLDYKIFPKTISTILVNVPSDFYPDSRVVIGPVAIAPENVDIMGKNLIKVTVPPDEALKTLLKDTSEKSASEEVKKGKKAKAKAISNKMENDRQPILIISNGSTQQIGVVHLLNSGDPETKEKVEKNLKEKQETKKYVYP